jgi:rhodanese-related sulfurtransferase
LRRPAVDWGFGLLVALFLFPLRAHADDASGYCGLYCVYGAAWALQIQIDFARLIDTKYVGPDGSSAAQLERAAADCGLTASPCSGLGLETLRTGPYPMILHVAAGEQLDTFNHWILCLGCDGARLDIVDAQGGRDLVPLAQILAKWDGSAIFVNSRPVGVGSVRAHELLLYAQYSVLALALLAAASYLQPRFLPIGRRDATATCGFFASIRQLSTIVTIAVLLGVFLHAVDSAGFLRNPGATSFVAAAHIDSLLPSRSLAELKPLAENGKVVFVDARFPRDYEQGHIPGAISLPIDAPPSERAAVLSRIPRDREIVVYCQSQGCHFKDVVATCLIREGFARVSMFPGGWVEWRDAPLRSAEAAVVRQ